MFFRAGVRNPDVEFDSREGIRESPLSCLSILNVVLPPGMGFEL
jgi:hypothetical protein